MDVEGLPLSAGIVIEIADEWKKRRKKGGEDSYPYPGGPPFSVLGSTSFSKVLKFSL